MSFSGSDIELTPEGAGNSYSYNSAGFPIRFLAYIIDFSIILGLSFISISLLELLQGTWGSQGTLPVEEIIGLVFEVYMLLFWILTSYSLGKILLGLAIVDNYNEEPISLEQAILRLIGMILSFSIMSLGFFWIALGEQKRGWHDYIAGTKVVYRR